MHTTKNTCSDSRTNVSSIASLTSGFHCKIKIYSSSQIDVRKSLTDTVTCPSADHVTDVQLNWMTTARTQPKNLSVMSLWSPVKINDH